ncbi:MAG: hydroxysqualene dehydroxylase HpnE [Planctomycetota bacterium]
MADPKRVVVVGGGLAGITAALGAVERGWHVTLCESRPFLGGKIYSLPAGPKAPPGTEVDNGQHVYMRCCTRFIALLERLGAGGDARLLSPLDVPVLSPDGVRARLKAWPLPAPLHMAWSLLRYRPLTLGERWKLGRAARAVQRVTAAERAALDGVPFADWLAQHGQSDNAIARFWDIFIVSTLNVPCREASTALALMVLNDGLFSTRDAGEIGISTVGLSRLIPERAVDRLAEQGAEIRTRTRVSQLTLDGAGERVTGVTLAGGNPVEADAVVLAVPHTRLPSLLPEPWGTDPFFADAPKLGASPILNIHLGFDRPVTGDWFFALYDSPVHWVFNKGRILGDAGQDGRYLSLTTSAAARATRGAKDGVLEEALTALRRALPAAREARVEWSRVVVEGDATFAARPGSQQYRRPAATPVGGLLLAGAWTDTGWPATMEGAVRSGEAAAACLGSTA